MFTVTSDTVAKKKGSRSRPVAKARALRRSRVRDVRNPIPKRSLTLNRTRLTSLDPIGHVWHNFPGQPLGSELRKSLRRSARPPARVQEGVRGALFTERLPFAGFRLPEKVNRAQRPLEPCHARKVRRSVLHAMRRVGRGSGNKRTRKFSDKSLERC